MVEEMFRWFNQDKVPWILNVVLACGFLSYTCVKAGRYCPEVEGLPDLTDQSEHRNNWKQDWIVQGKL